MLGGRMTAGWPEGSRVRPEWKHQCFASVFLQAEGSGCICSSMFLELLFRLRYWILLLTNFFFQLYVYSFILFFFFTLFYFTILYWFCRTLTWIHHRCTGVPKHEPPSHLPPHNISLGHPRAPAPSMLYPASDIDWWFNSYMIVYMFQQFFF